MTHSENKRSLISMIGNGAQKAGAKLYEYEKMTLSPRLNYTVNLIFSYIAILLYQNRRENLVIFLEKNCKKHPGEK